MSEWLSPIYDRTQEDIEFAISKITEWLNDSSFVPYDLKGCLNVADLNRIEGNIEYLSEYLSQLGYPSAVHIRKWSVEDIPIEQDTTRIVENIQSIIDGFLQPTNTPPLPDNMLTFGNINAIEENLYLIKYLLDCMVNSFRKSATFQSGSTVFLPIRR